MVDEVEESTYPGERVEVVQGMVWLPKIEEWLAMPNVN